MYRNIAIKIRLIGNSSGGTRASNEKVLLVSIVKLEITSYWENFKNRESEIANRGKRLI